MFMSNHSLELWAHFGRIGAPSLLSAFFKGELFWASVAWLMVGAREYLASNIFQ